MKTLVEIEENSGCPVADIGEGEREKPAGQVNQPPLLKVWICHYFFLMGLKALVAL